MGAVTTLVATVAAAAGAVVAYRFIDNKRREFREIFTDGKKRGDNGSATVIDYERDPESGVYRPKD